ncbi:hypothetical protein [Tritonibacter mobilis]|uniref:hypothetical protein n=1 Tax=Tritonibacter mobilis TaxID=379347 RepID=UPI001C953AFA|nr:hypothetical protein [Tritonibacter mobilis]MBY5998653.1 hypothetical protein [Tritonibacter mobilis]
MVAEECRSACFIDLAGGDHKNELNNVVLFRFHAQSIEVQKEVGCGEAGTLVSVDKGGALQCQKDRQLRARTSRALHGPLSAEGDEAQIPVRRHEDATAQDAALL